MRFPQDSPAVKFSKKGADRFMGEWAPSAPEGPLFAPRARANSNINNYVIRFSPLHGRYY